MRASERISDRLLVEDGRAEGCNFGEAESPCKLAGMLPSQLGRRVCLGLSLVVLASASSVMPASLDGQEPGSVAPARSSFVGVVLGRTTSRQLWSPEVSEVSRDGIVIGGFLEVPVTGRLSIRAGAEYVQRGATIERDTEGRPADGEVRTDYASFPIHLKISGSLGALRLHIACGPTVEQLLRSRKDPVLALVLDEDHPVVVGLAVSAGAGLHLSDRFVPELEVRLTEGLSKAHAGSFVTVRNRSVEVLLRVGVPRRRDEP